MQPSSERNQHIDFFRGIAAFNIIIIHTAFWFGAEFVPEPYRNLTLLIDVPFFFYLSGWSSGFRESSIIKSGKSLLKIWFKWVYFITIVELVCILFPSLTGVSGLEDLFRNYLFNVSIPGFPVIAGSVWFMPVYFLVIIVNAMILALIQKSEEKKELQRTFMWLLLCSYVWVLYGNQLFGFPPGFLFYSFFWMLGLIRF